MFNSLRTRLLIWQVVLLVVVLLTFGSAVFYQWRKNLLSDLDKELMSSATVLEGTLRGVASVQGPQQGETKTKQKEKFRPGFSTSDRPKKRPKVRPDPGGKGRPDDPRGLLILAGTVEPDLFDLPHELGRDLGRSRPFYFVIYDVNNQIIASFPDREFRIPRDPGGHRLVDVGSEREIVQRGPGGTVILVGRDVADFNRRSASFLLWLALIGLGVLVVGCVAGYWLTGRAIAPVREVSETVKSISGSKLDSRIDTTKMDYEFVQLSTLVNEMLDRLETTIEQQKVFVGDASHELRTPVAVIGMHAELALAAERSPEEYRKTLQTCLRASQRLKALTEDLLALAKSDSGQTQTKLQELDICQLVKESTEFLMPLAKQNEVNLVDGCSSPVNVRGDKRLLRQLIDNLITNSIVHNRLGGKSSVSVFGDEKKIELRIADDGPGIPASELPLVFQRFYRLDKSRSREGGGSGLGLSIAQDIAQIHGGEISIESEEGQGTTVKLSLPLC